jgi:hypothetical protein
MRGLSIGEEGMASGVEDDFDIDAFIEDVRSSDFTGTLPAP